MINALLMHDVIIQLACNYIDGNPGSGIFTDFLKSGVFSTNRYSREKIRGYC